MDGKTTLGPTIEIEGEVQGAEDLIVLGSIQGKIVCKQSLSVENSGRVEAAVSTRNLSVSGKLTGNVDASELVEVKKDGRMVGDIKAPRVRIADGAKFKGHIDMGE